jgi:hypothetical protein
MEAANNNNNYDKLESIREYFTTKSEKHSNKIQNAIVDSWSEKRRELEAANNTENFGTQIAEAIYNGAETYVMKEIYGVDMDNLGGNEEFKLELEDAISKVLGFDKATLVDMYEHETEIDMPDISRVYGAAGQNVTRKIRGMGEKKLSKISDLDEIKGYLGHMASTINYDFDLEKVLDIRQARDKFVPLMEEYSNHIRAQDQSDLERKLKMVA